MLILLFGFACSLYAKTFTMVYLDRTSVTMEALSFVKKQIKTQKSPLKLAYANGFKGLKGNEDVVVILNTGLSQGTDQRITTYLSQITDKKKVMVVNLYSLGNQAMYERILASDSVHGVDEISAASWYDEGKGFSKGNTLSLDMHTQWVTELFSAVEGK